ncbi:MAG TPA: PQQ-dependent sugar dehydrogenase [Nitrososphaeraceae archaeon]|nr:PQQ-dependent sugar dehydrogenase [Nitrososphaeraceae archaeon]
MPAFTQFYNEISQTPYLYQSDDNGLRIELFADGLAQPTSMTFVGKDTILVLEKDTGMVRVVNNGILENDSVLSARVDPKAERGLLGIDVLKMGAKNDDYVFIYLTERTNEEYDVRNRVYRYNWNGTNLSHPVTLLDLPGEPGPYHNGGKIKIGPDNQLYVVIGDLTNPSTILQNHVLDSDSGPNNTSVIMRINPLSGNPSPNNPFINQSQNDSSSLDYYYAYGIRNSFGLSFDPVTGNLWDTENGEDKFDETNLVKPGFNSGWYKIMGPLSRNENFSKNDLVMLNKSYYSDPKFSWAKPIGVTDLEFYNSSRLGDKFSNNIFIGDINNGNLYFFKVDENRTGIKIDSPASGLTDSIADPQDDLSPALFARGFSGRISDIETGPDGYIYVLTYSDGRIYRIVK